MEIKIVKDTISLDEVARIAKESYGDMTKAVCDINRGVLVIGGEMHADAAEALFADGSKTEDLWGFNIYPAKKREDWLEYNSLINIKPSQNHKSMDIENAEIRNKIKETVDNLIK